jgi:WD40 repeat protein
LWDALTGKEQIVLKGHRACVYATAFSPDQRILATGGGQRQLILWDTATGKKRAFFEEHTALVSSLSFSSDAKRLATAGGDVFTSQIDGEVYLWDYERREARVTLPVPGGAWSLAFAPDGRVLAIGDGRQNLWLWDAIGDTDIRLPQGAGVRSVAFAPDGWTVAVGTGWTVKLWNLKDLQNHINMRGHQGFVWSVAFSPDGRQLISGSEDGLVKAWDVASGKELASYDWQIGKIRAVAVAPDGMTAVAGGDGDIVMWDMEN